jgi:DNA-binding NtrC family response regulator
MVDLNQSKIVVLEADSSRRDFLKSTFLKWGYIPFVFEKESICLDNLASLNPDLVISGSCSSDNALRFINSLKMIRHSLPVLLLADDSSVEDYISTSGFTGVQVFRKNTSLNKFRYAVLQALDSKASEGNDGAQPLIIGDSPEILKIKKLIPKLGQSNEAIIIEGEPGTGKELMARAIHGHSNRRHNPFIKVNAVKLPYQLLGGELFGYQDCGAANFPRHKNGVLGVSNKTTFFIKEISVIPNWLQARISELIEGGFYSFDSRDGSKRNTIDIRIIASTSHNLSGLVKKGFFREDLFYRLNVLKVRIPPLRDRISDIPALTDFFTCKHCHEFNKNYYKITSSTISGFCDYHWTGNVKELETVVKQIVLSGNEEIVFERLVQAKDEKHSRKWRRGHNCVDNDDRLNDIKNFLKKTNTYSLKLVRREFLFAIEKKFISKALELARGNRKEAAALLEVSYKSLLNRLKVYSL